jgi:hypothetical protein
MIGHSLRIRWTSFALTCALAVGTLAAGAGAQGSPSPGVPIPLDAWILLGKPKHKKGLPGMQIFARGRVVAEADNPHTGATGDIGDRHIPDPPDPRFGCHCTHFHGSFKPVVKILKDPDPNHCGWGCVALHSLASDVVADLSDAIMAEELAMDLIDEFNPQGALEELAKARASLALALSGAPQVGDRGWKRSDASKFEDALTDADSADAKASTALLAALNTPPGSNKRRKKLQKALQEIQEAFELKQKAMIRLGQWELR